MFGVFCPYFGSSYTLKKKVKHFLVFLTMIIIIAAVYGNDFITSTKEKYCTLKVVWRARINNQSRFIAPKKKPI
jgi:hypothetical protein